MKVKIEETQGIYCLQVYLQTCLFNHFPVSHSPAAQTARSEPMHDLASDSTGHLTSCLSQVAEPPGEGGVTASLPPSAKARSKIT